MIVGIIGSFLVFVNDRVNWAMLAGMVSLATGSFGLLLWSILRRDKVPDFLGKIDGSAFERDGFCFKIGTRFDDGRCLMFVHFQTRHDHPSRMKLVLQSSQGFFLNRPNFASMTVEIDCPAGGYGVTTFPWPVAKKLAGKTLSIDVAGDVRYPEGKGKMIRYRGGLPVGSAGSNPWNTALTVAGALGGMIVLTKPAKMKLKLPKDIDENIDENAPIETQILWQLGD